MFVCQSRESSSKLFSGDIVADIRINNNDDNDNDDDSTNGWDKLQDISRHKKPHWDANNDAIMIGPCSHAWLFEHVAAVVHHGGAGEIFVYIFKKKSKLEMNKNNS